MDKSGKIVGVNFFSQEKFDKNLYVSMLKEESFHAEKALFGDIIADFESGSFVLNTQEISYIKNFPEKAVDYIVYRYKFRVFPERKILTDFPIYLLIEPTSVCNLRCKMCFQTDSFFSNKSNMGAIDLGFYKELINQAQEGKTGALTMASRGEPLLNKNFGQMLEYANGKFFELKVNTNAMLMDKNASHMFLSNGLTDLVFSIDSADKNQYESMRVGADFDRVLSNIKKFNQIREKFYPNSKLRTRISGVKCDDSQDLDKFVSFWSSYVDSVAYVNCVDRKDSYNNELSNVKYPCKTLWNRMYVWWDGTCNPCDFDFRSELGLGNAKEKTLKEIWNGQWFNELREAHLKGTRDSISPCNVCHL